MQTLPDRVDKPAVAIVGCGRVGTAIGKILRNGGYRISGVATSKPETARRAAQIMGSDRWSDCPWEVTRGGDVVFITTPDDVIESICAKIAQHRGFKEDAVVIHCSGALPSEILSSARQCGALAATLHPLQSFASAEQAVGVVPGSYFTVEGDAEALSFVRQIVDDLEGVLLEISAERKTLYHAAAAAASNYLVVLMDLVLGLSEAAGLSRDMTFEAFLPLIKGTLSNIGAEGIPGALTGPIARGDVQTVLAHIKAIERDAPGLISTYRCLGQHAVALAKAKGTINEKAAQKLIALLAS